MATGLQHSHPATEGEPPLKKIKLDQGTKAEVDKVQLITSFVQARIKEIESEEGDTNCHYVFCGHSEILASQFPELKGL